MIKVGDWVLVSKAKNPYDWISDMDIYDKKLGKITHKEMSKYKHEKIKMTYKIKFYGEEEQDYHYWYSDSLIKLTKQEAFLNLI
jgi:secreted PhoX family phosphatase